MSMHASSGCPLLTAAQCNTYFLFSKEKHNTINSKNASFGTAVIILVVYVYE